MQLISVCICYLFISSFLSRYKKEILCTKQLTSHHTHTHPPSDVKREYCFWMLKNEMRYCRNQKQNTKKTSIDAKLEANEIENGVCFVCIWIHMTFCCCCSCVDYRRWWMCLLFMNVSNAWFFFRCCWIQKKINPKKQDRKWCNG